MAKKAVKRRAARSARRRPSKAQKRTRKAGRTSGRKAVRARKAPRKAVRKRAPAVAARRRAAAPKRRPAPSVKTRKAGGTGREEELAQTPQTGRSVQGPTNPMPTKRSTGTAAGAGSTRRVPGLERARKQLREIEETVPTPPSSLDLDRRPSAARTGRHELAESRREHNEVSPDLTAGDVDADWEDAYSVGDEAPGGDNPTPDQDRVDDIGKALGVQYDDNEELKAADKIAQRDKHRWELDPASSDDYQDRD
jgi:Family of unknown function (DUF6335)